MRNKKVLTLILALIFILQNSLTVFARGTSEKPYYDDFVIFGDSICLGFSTAAASMASTETYNIEKNAVEALYPHCYPTVFGNMIGLDTNYQDDGNVDVYNFGVCAAWSKDIYQLLTDPFYLYTYYCDDYDKDTLLTLPEEYNGVRYIVDTEAEGYDVGNVGTWQYKMDEEGNYVGTEEYTIPAGYEIHVCYEMNFWGSTYLMVNPVIQEKYFYVSSNCFDEEGTLIDTNNDGNVDDSDIIYYPTKAGQYGYSADESEENIAKYGHAVRNPEFTKYYYDYMTDKVKNGDLIALAAGGNDIYHSFMPYQQNSGTTLGSLVYWITYALQMNYSLNDILSMLGNDYWQQIIFGETLNQPAVAALAAEDSSETAVESESVDSDNSGAGQGSDVGDMGQSSVIAGLFSQEEIIKLLEYYSKENISEYLKDVVEDYKVYYEKTIQRVLDLKQDKSELVLVGHFNPFGMENYLAMLAENLKSGVLFEDLNSDTKALMSLLQAILGDSSDYAAIQNMNEEQRAELVAQSSLDLNNLLEKLKNNPNLSDEELTKLFVDLSYPLAVLIMGDGLSGVYEDLNSFVEEMSEKYDLAYVDVSNAPTSGRYDPHPTEAGHKWIANKLYETVVPGITASISSAGTGKGTITPEGTTNYRLRDSQEYIIVPDEGSKISAIFVDGQCLDPVQYEDVYSTGRYTFEGIMKNHCISVQFDTDDDYVKKYTVDIIDSYSEDGAGEGLYEAGSTVTINAGTRDRYEFAGWVTDDVELADATNPTTTFEMPSNDVTISAAWTEITEEDTTEKDKTDEDKTKEDITKEDTTKKDATEKDTTKEDINSYTLSFQTNGGSKISPISKEEGTVINLEEYKPTKEGFEFDGWYSDRDLTVKIESVEFNRDTTVYAKWTSIEETVLPKTGDNNNITLWTSLAVISVLGILTTVIIKKRKFN